MLVQMTTAEQQQYLRHDDKSGSRLTPLTSAISNANPRSMKIVKGCLTQDIRELQVKEAQHDALEGAFKDVDVAIEYDYNVTTLSITD